jgi:hypothetical protein
MVSLPPLMTSAINGISSSNAGPSTVGKSNTP